MSLPLLCGMLGVLVCGYSLYLVEALSLQGGTEVVQASENAVLTAELQARYSGSTA